MSAAELAAALQSVGVQLQSAITAAQQELTRVGASPSQASLRLQDHAGELQKVDHAQFSAGNLGGTSPFGAGEVRGREL